MVKRWEVNKERTKNNIIEFKEGSVVHSIQYSRESEEDEDWREREDLAYGGQYSLNLKIVTLVQMR